MLKTYRIIPLVFILFLFGFTFSTVSPLFAQTVDQLIESIEKLDANDRARVLEYKYSPPNRPSDATPAAAADGPWDKSMGMRHPARPCMDRTKVRGGCGPDTRSPEQIASDPYDTNNPVSLAARAESGAHSPSPPPSDVTPVAVADGSWDPCNTNNTEQCNTCSTMITRWSSYIKEHGREYCIESRRVQGDQRGEKNEVFGMRTECIKQGPRDHNGPSVQVMQASHDRCMKDARRGCGGDRSKIKAGKRSIRNPMGIAKKWNPPGSAISCGFEEFHLHCYKGGCTNGEGIHMKFDRCANANASDVIASRNGCQTHKLSDGTPRSYGHKDCAVSKC
jgi:hypothetical protein